MFVQVIQGRTSDAGQVRAQLDKWTQEVAPGAVGWLGSTSGVTEDGQVIALARFESEEAAQQNSDRPEQTAWWEEMAALFTDEPVFHNSPPSRSTRQVTPRRPASSRSCRAVRATRIALRELMANDPTDWSELPARNPRHRLHRPRRDAWTMAIYFTSEAAAREGEQKEPPPEMQQMMKEMDSLSIGEPVFLDLKDPWLDAPS